MGSVSRIYGIKLNFRNDIHKVEDFVEVCKSFQSPIDIKAGRYMVDGKSLFGVMAICHMQDITAWLISSNPNEHENFAEAMKEFV